MAAPPEPHRDQRTIGSFKKTFNAAILIAVARASSPTPPSRVRRTIGMGILLVLLAAHGMLKDVDHALTWLIS